MEIDTASRLLALVAVAAVLQLAGTIIAIVILTRHASRASAALESLVEDARPVLRRTAIVLDDIQDLAARARRADAAAQAVVGRMVTTWTTAKVVVRSRLWPVLGAARAVQAIARALRRRTDAVDRHAEQRFNYEGGANAVE